ncbi:MAG: carboxypeptidase regulatory-like domain-containing protein, partial [Planctomycetota bacterium]
DATSDTTLEFAGTVVDPSGTPAVGAQMFLVFHIPEPTGLLVPKAKPLATTDAEGKYQFTVRPSDFGGGASAGELGFASLVARKEGFGCAGSRAALHESSGQSLSKLRERLQQAPAAFAASLKRMLGGAGKPMQLIADDQPLRGRVVDINGQPVAGARLTLLTVASNHDNDLTAWRKATQDPKADYYSARMQTPRVINGPQVRSLVTPATTDAEGRFQLRGVGQGRIAELLVEGAHIENSKIFARTEAGEAIELLRERRSPDLGRYTYHPATFTHVAGPTAVIAGVVRDSETDAPLAGVTVKSQSRHGEPISGWGQDFVRAVTDGEGRYQLVGMPIGSDNRIAAIAPPG